MHSASAFCMSPYTHAVGRFATFGRRSCCLWTTRAHGQRCKRVSDCGEPLRKSDASAGFTLSELLVATALSVLVIGGVIVMMLAQYEAYW